MTRGVVWLKTEGLFRSYKRTLAKVHLSGRTVRSVHRQAYGPLLACQLLLARGALALKGARGRSGAVVACGVRRAACGVRPALLAVREELRSAMRPVGRASYRDRLAGCVRERRERSVAKQKREWPQRRPHKPPKPPHLLTMTDEEKALAATLNATK